MINLNFDTDRQTHIVTFRAPVSAKKKHLGVSVTAQMTRVTQGLSLTVDITALVTLQLSVEEKRTTLDYTRSMAQGGKKLKHIFLH